MISTCYECPIGLKVKRKICVGCAQKTLGRKRIQSGICATCETERPPRTEVTFGNMIIAEVGHEPNIIDKSLAHDTACKGIEKRRPDLLWVVKGSVAVVVEIDEDSHKEREASCELSKVSEQNYAIQIMDANIPVYTIRVNPDAYDKRRVNVIERARVVGRIVRKLLAGTYDRNAYAKVLFCYYHSHSAHLIDAHKLHWDCEVIT